jgi:ATP-dependent protease HslVU (ClpYQ) peptidase subunit
MTTVAYDGESMSADTQATSGNRSFKSQKMFSLDDGSVVGFSGPCGLNVQLLNWFNTGMIPEEYPEDCKGKTEPYCFALHVRPDKSIWQYDSGPYPYLIMDKQAAIGSGADFAIAAMACGKDSSEAVKIAALFDTSTNNVVRTEFPDFV